MRFADLLARMLCVLALIGASLPISASEAVCVLPSKAVVPMATCGMPCCSPRKETKTSCAMPIASCCRGLDKAAGRSTTISKFGCRCEIRPKATVAVPATTKLSLPVTVSLPAVLTEVPLPAVAEWTFVPEPGIVGADSGPPPEPCRYRSFGRAPPAR